MASQDDIFDLDHSIRDKFGENSEEGQLFYEIVERLTAYEEEVLKARRMKGAILDWLEH